MALSTETASWLESLKKEGNLSDEVITQLRTAAESNPKADEFLKGSVLRQADYSRNSAAVKEAQTAVEKAAKELAEREAGVTKFQKDLAEWKTGAEGNYSKAIKERETSEKKAVAALARLKATGAAYGIDETELLKDLEIEVPNPNPNNPNPTFDASKYVTREQIQEVTRESALIDATIHDLSEEYRELYGKPLRGAATLVQEAIAAKKPLRVYAEEKLEFGKKRQEVDAASVQKRIDDAVAAERTKILSEAGLPGTTNLRSDLRGSPVFRDGGLPQPKGPETGGGVSAAVAAFQSGKHSVRV